MLGAIRALPDHIFKLVENGPISDRNAWPSMERIDEALVIAALLLLLAALASKASSRLGIPALLLFLVVGMLAGSDGPGGIPFDDAALTQAVGTVALAFILFAGGLETDRKAISAVLKQGLSLACIGVLITAALVGSFAAWLLKLSWLEGLLLGAIVSSTDAAAVFSVLRSQGIALKGRLQALLELESGTNDPMAVFLTLGLIQLLTSPGLTPLTLLPLFAKQMAIGGVIGWILGRAAVPFINLIRLDAEGLYSALTVAIVLLTYGSAAALGGSGFLAVYLAGLMMSNREFVHRQSLTRFHDGLAWLSQIVLFLLLGLLVFPSRLLPVASVSLALAVFLVIVARPVSVFLSLAFSRLEVRPKLLISWVGLRGAVPIVLATFPRVAGVEHAELYFDVVFFTVVISVLIQGTSVGWIARRLDLQAAPSGHEDFGPGKPGVTEVKQAIGNSENSMR